MASCCSCWQRDVFFRMFIFRHAGDKLKRILIIDDVRDRAAWLKASLELADYAVIGVLAWEQVDEHAIQAASADVIIVDADAPGRDTLEQISLMSRTLEKPVVVLGGQKDSQSIKAAMQAGMPLTTYTWPTLTTNQYNHGLNGFRTMLRLSPTTGGNNLCRPS